MKNLETPGKTGRVGRYAVPMEVLPDLEINYRCIVESILVANP